jgi:hypothetical protein
LEEISLLTDVNQAAPQYNEIGYQGNPGEQLFFAARSIVAYPIFY